MSRAPLLTRKVLTSLEAVLKVLAPADYLGTEREAGIKYLTALVKHEMNSATVDKRRKRVATVIANRKH